MKPENRLLNDPRERLPALALAVAVTILVFAAIDAGFTPQATGHDARALSVLSL